jgi:RNA polymerase sigma-70 factor, ECF subfamily
MPHRGRYDAAIEAAVRLASATARAALVAAIEHGLDEAREAWPAGPEPDAELGAYLAERLEGDAPPHVADLYLAWWAQRDSDGAAAFEARYGRDIERVVQRFPRLDADELRQLLRVKLFVGPSKLAEYTGRGALHSWLRVVASRTFVDAARAAARDLPLREDVDDPLLAIADGAFDVPRALDRHVLRDAIRRAFARAVAALRERERTFLRLCTNEGLTLEQVAAAYHVGRATVARDLASARAHLREQTRRELEAILELAPTELDSVIRGLDSNLELSLARVLGPPAPT